MSLADWLWTIVPAVIIGVCIGLIVGVLSGSIG